MAETVADKLGMKELPKPADAAVAPRDDLEPSPALSIIENGPDSFAGRKVGVLVSAGADRRAAEEAAVGDRKGRRGHGGHCAQGRRRRGSGR